MKYVKEEMVYTNQNFSFALEVLKKGAKVSRKGWNGKGMYLKLQEPSSTSKMTLPYIYMKTADGNLVPWLASQTDMLADDWEVRIDKDVFKFCCTGNSDYIKKTLWPTAKINVEKILVEGGIVDYGCKCSDKSKREVLKAKLSIVPGEKWSPIGCNERSLPLFQNSEELEIATNIVYALDGLNLSKVKDILHKVDKSIDHILKI
ncbi:DUF2829 domain-containing protein [Clostridium sp. LP20]|uniref:DUF2829 domain-containing protein n=1 Tax=Clostridium sp. LP20 TaxID=3418665 RepID=UPI003EE5F07E